MTAAVKEIRASTWSGLATVLTFSIHVSAASTVSTQRISCSKLLFCYGCPAWVPLNRGSFCRIAAKSANIGFAGTEKLKKVQAGIFACLANAQEDEVFFDPSRRRETPDSPAEPGKGLDRVFGVVVIPGNTVVA